MSFHHIWFIVHHNSLPISCRRRYTRLGQYIRTSTSPHIYCISTHNNSRMDHEWMICYHNTTHKSEKRNDTQRQCKVIRMERKSLNCSAILFKSRKQCEALLALHSLAGMKIYKSSSKAASDKQWKGRLRNKHNKNKTENVFPSQQQ